VQVRDYRVSGAPTSAPVDLVFDQFDPGLGTLLTVGFVFQFVVQSASVDFENTGPHPTVAVIDVGKVVNYRGPGLPITRLLFHSVFLFEQAPVAFGAFDGALDFAGPDTFAFRQAIPAGDTLFASPTSLSPYLGTGTVPLAIIGFLSAGIGGAPDVHARLNGEDVSGVVTLTYEVAPAAVPEPGALSLFGVGVLAWAAFPRARRLSRPRP
jgi:hypothetical protein